jgi:hypothetical protein
VSAKYLSPVPVRYRPCYFGPLTKPLLLIYRAFKGSFLLVVLAAFTNARAQMITGVWHGKINKQRVEVKIIQNGDSLTGTSYYYESSNNYRRYTIKGYFDLNTNAAVWWDDMLVEEKSGRFSILTPGKAPLLTRADFNCPGSGRMMLDGKAAKKDDDAQPRGDVHLDKVSGPVFEDEWDYVIENYITGANDPEVIDSIGALSGQPIVTETIGEELPKSPPVAKPKTPEPQKPVPAIITTKEPERINPPTITEKFSQRKKVLVSEIPVTGDSIELRFYDNAEIDGDSISIFLNDRLIYQHIRLTGNAYTIKLAVSELNSTNELIMVAENLGSIPPNTSYMVALVADKRYDARLESTEGSSAMIRFIKK